jgi:serine protease inhibitor
MGVTAIFDIGEFSRLSSTPLKVSRVKHKAIIEVDREGTVGSASTGTCNDVMLRVLEGSRAREKLLAVC